MERVDLICSLHVKIHSFRNCGRHFLTLICMFIFCLCYTQTLLQRERKMQEMKQSGGKEPGWASI